MEQTINLFSKGLQLDTNPMVQSNDTLSDALNATFITQNGNEVVLLNDMGNRRVDNAYLPSGYEPVGMKEYGGIIYIAAYNPITGKSQIGSFPSPERKISKSDDNNLGNKKVDFVNDFRDAVKTGYGLYWLTDDTLLYPLTNKNSIHAGDKFVVYGFSNATDTVTNYNNVNENKVITPLNKTYTLQLGVLNSLNEFVDITKTLVRWDANDNKISFDKDVTDLYRFNSGYFLPKGIVENNDLSETINDSNFINERTALKLALNTYAYKLVGPLYLKAILNHIEEFNYDIYGTYESDIKEAKLTIDGYITYNCPHELISSNDIDDEDYITFDDGKIKVRNSNNIEDNVNINSFFDFYYRTGENKDSSTFLNDNNIVIGETKYNKLTNLYTTKISKTYEITGNMISIGEIDPTSSEGYSDFLYFIIGVTTPLLEKAIDNLGNYNLEVYLEGLSVVDVINLNLLGSGKVFPREWRFHNDIENGFTKLVYNLNSYPKEGKQFINLSMELYDVEKNLNNILSNLPIENWILTDTIHLADTVFNGRVTREISWEGTKISEQHLYYVRLKWEILDKETGEIEESNGYTNLEEFPIWFLSTPLFNSCFNASSDDFIECYYKPLGKEIEVLNRKQLVELELIPNESKTYDYTQISTTGSIITKSEATSNNPYVMTTDRQVRYKLNPKIEIKNPNYYPKFVKINDNIESNIISSINVLYLYKYKNKTYEIEETNNLGQNLEFNNDLIYDNITYNDGSKSDGKIDGTHREIEVQQHKYDELLTTSIFFINRDVFKCSRESNDTEITNVFDSIRNTINPIIDELLGGDPFSSRGAHNRRYGALVILDYNDVHSNVAVDLGVALFCFNKSDGGSCDLTKYENMIWDDNGLPEGLVTSNSYHNLFSCPFDTADLEFSKKQYAEKIYDSRDYNSENQLDRDVLISSLSDKIYNSFNSKFPIENQYYPDFLFLFNNEQKNEEDVRDTQRMILNKENGHLRALLINYSRVWWRTSDQRWVLLKTPLLANRFVHRGSETTAKDYYWTRYDFKSMKEILVEYFKNFFTTDFVYCYTNKITAREAGLYIPTESKYTRPYNFDIQVCVRLLYASALVPNIIDNEGITTPLHFVSGGEVSTLRELDSYTIQSQESFYDIVSNMNLNSFNNIYLKTGKSVDIDGQPLDHKIIYIDLNNHGELVRANIANKKIANSIAIDWNNPYNKYNRILYNPSHEELEYVHDYRYDEDAPRNFVYIDYKGILTTPKTI